MFGKKKRNEQTALILEQLHETTAFIVQAIREVQQSRSKNGDLQYRMLAYFDQYIDCCQGIPSGLRDLRGEKDIFNVFRGLLREFNEQRITVLTLQTELNNLRNELARRP